MLDFKTEKGDGEGLDRWPVLEWKSIRTGPSGSMKTQRSQGLVQRLVMESQPELELADLGELPSEMCCLLLSKLVFSDLGRADIPTPAG